MKKLGTVIRYECTTSFKYIWVFYACVFAAISVISVIVFISTGDRDKIGTNGLELNSMIYVGILGVFGFKEDFKMLIQNGFTRKYIYLAALSLFAFTSAIMAAVDTIVGNGLHAVAKGYFSIFGGLYGYEHSVFINWLWLFLAYMLVCCLLYLAILIINRIGKAASIYLGIGLGLTFVLIIPVVFKFVLPKAFTEAVVEFAIKVIGFAGGNTINFLYPIMFLLLVAGIFSLGSYLIIRRTELKV